MNFDDDKQAIEFFQRSIEISLAVFGKLHPIVGTTYFGIGNAYSKLADHKQALNFFQKALANLLHCFGEDHPSVMTTRFCISQASLYDKQSQMNQVRPEKSLNIY